MLTDAPIKIIPRDLPRKWISDDYFDLIVWYRDNTIEGFQLCYGKPWDTQAITWFSGDRFSHHRIDEGDDDPTANRSPILTPGGTFQRDKVISEFNLRSVLLPPEIQNLVKEKIREYKEI